MRSDSVFEFRARKRNHKPYFEPKSKERWVVTDHPCVLLQRTTAKEQCRRLIAAELREQFIQEHGAVVVENHLNMIKPYNGQPKVSPAVLAALLNSDVVDRCSAASTAAWPCQPMSCKRCRYPPLTTSRESSNWSKNAQGRKPWSKSLSSYTATR